MEAVELPVSTRHMDMDYSVIRNSDKPYTTYGASGAKVRDGIGIVDLDDTIHTIIKEAGHGEHVFGPPIHGVGIEFEESPLPPGHAFFHGEKAPPPLPANVVISVGNCGLYVGPWGVRVEDTNVIGVGGPTTLTTYPRILAAQ